MRLRQYSVAITDRSSVGEARRAALTAATQLGFDEERRSDVGIVATELANNVVLHAQRGEFLICPTPGPDPVNPAQGAALDLLALDHGAGIPDIGRALEDGFSTIGTAGQGLGAIQRLADAASIYSAAGKGTVGWARFGPPSEFGVVNIPLDAEPVAGDSFLVHHDGARSLFMLVDGLGHGHGAAEAAEEAVVTVRQHLKQPLGEILHRTHDALKKTRGAALALALADRAAGRLVHAGVGNISGLLLGRGGSRSIISQNGTLGAAMPRTVQETTLPLEPGATLVLFSDGLTSKVNPSQYLGFQRRPAMLLAGLLYRDFSRRRDDATVLIARPGSQSDAQVGGAA